MNTCPAPSAPTSVLPPARTDLAWLTAGQLAPLEQRLRGWPDVWCDFARSLYATLIGGDAPMPLQQAADLAVALVHGIASDLGGTQPYIPVGSAAARVQHMQQVVDLLRQHCQDYDHVAALLGISTRHVRRLEAQWWQQQRAQRQASLF